MAKGFTVKAAAPPQKTAEDWDYDAIKERMRGKSIVFCLTWTEDVLLSF
jgi:hypothetical protein